LAFLIRSGFPWSRVVLSERSVEFQDSVESWSPRIGLLIVTSRKGVVVPYRMLEIHPLPISSVSVLSRYIENEIAKPQSNASADPLRDTASIVNILVHTLAPIRTRASKRRSASRSLRCWQPPSPRWRWN
jgi:hypothetical protein